MHHKVASYLTSISARTVETQGQGATLKQFQVANALELASDHPAITHHLENGFDIVNCERVSFTNSTNWIDILIRLESAQEGGSIGYVITYEADTIRLIAVSKVEKEFRCLDDDAAQLPFALEVASHNVDVVATNRQVEALNTRRELFTKATIAALVPFLGAVSPAMSREITTTDTKITKATHYPTTLQKTDKSDDPTTTADYSWDP